MTDENYAGDFAIVAEGYTDQVVIDHVLQGFYTGDDEPVVNYEQPRLDATGRKTMPEPGGWTLVLEYFRSRRFEQALQLNRYLVVHIDTDVSDDFGIRKTNEQGELSTEELIAQVTALFRGLIGEAALAQHSGRFIFAIAVHSTECWLLPLLYENPRASRTKTKACLDAANTRLRAQNAAPLSKSDHSDKNPAVYKKVSKDLRKPKTLRECAEHQASLRILLDQLGACPLRAPSSDSAS